MTSRRILLISKQFWPMAGETELLADAMANALIEAGVQVDVVTWRIVKQWPERFTIGNVNVHRLAWNSRGTWSPTAFSYYGRNRWHRGLQRWLAGRRSEYDASIVFEYPDDGMAPTLIVAKAGLPTVVRVTPAIGRQLPTQSLRDLQWCTDERTRLVSPESEFHSRIQSDVASPVAWPAVHHIPDGIEAPVFSNSGEGDDTIDDADHIGNPSQKQIRKVLENVHPIFKLDADALLAVCGADLTFESGVFSLVRSWRQVLDKHPMARLWLIGSGKNAPELFQRVCDLDMQHSVLLTGNFDEIRDVLAAANAYIMPGVVDAAGWYSGMAAALGLTIIHHQNAPVVQSFDRTTNRLPFDDDRRPIDLVIRRWASSADNPDSNSDEIRTTESETERKISRDQFSIQTMAQRYLQLIDQATIGERQSQTPTTAEQTGNNDST